MLLSIACQGTQESGWKKQKIRKNYADKVIIRFYSITYCCFKTSPSFPKHPSKYFLRNIWQSILAMPARFRRIIHQQVQVWWFETFYSRPDSLTIVLLSKYIEQQPSYPWYSPNCCCKMLSLSNLVTAKLPQSRSCPKLPVAYQFSHRVV